MGGAVGGTAGGTPARIAVPGGARSLFQRQLTDLQGAVLTLGGMVDQAVFRAADALERRSPTMAQRVVREDGRINRQRADVEATALHLLGTQQPMASDLRFLTAVLHMATDLERMGDHALNVGRCVLSLETAGGPPLPLPPETLAMATLDRARLRAALDALRDRDAAGARAVALRDAETDALQDAAYRALLAAMRARTEHVRQATLLLRAVYAFERVGDRVTDLCESVVYTVTGRLEELSLLHGEGP